MKKYKFQFNKYLDNYGRWNGLFRESVVHVSKYLTVLKNILNNEKKIIIKIDDFIKKIKFINNCLKTYKIKFEYLDENSRDYGIIRGNCYKDKIIIFINDEFEEALSDSYIFSLMMKSLMPLIGHELVHRGQYYVRKGDFINFVRFEKPEETNYEHKQEIMAYALMAIENMRYNGFSDDEIFSKISKGNISGMESGIIKLYISDIKEKNEKVYKKFIKYVIEYLVDPIKYELKVNF